MKKVSEEEDEFGVFVQWKEVQEVERLGLRKESHTVSQRGENLVHNSPNHGDTTYKEERKRSSQFSPIIEEPLSPTQTGSCVESMTPCASPQSEITFEDLSKALIVSKGGSSK
jgi:hypothetical protein